MRRPERRALGFTLLEVLAAFLVFAVLFTVLAGVASEAFRVEGENRRRLEASLLADAAFARIEEAARRGSVPPLGEYVEEGEFFTLATLVEPLSASDLGLDAGRDPAPRRGEPEEASLLFPREPDESPLLRIELRVGWQEGHRDVEVQRTTIALDTSNLPQFPGGGGDGGQDDGLEGSGGGEDDEEEAAESASSGSSRGPSSSRGGSGARTREEEIEWMLQQLGQ